MKRVLALFALLAVALPVSAQNPDADTKLRIHIGYGFTPSFDKPGGGTDRFEGPEIGVALPIGTFARQQLLLEPSFFGGGRLRHGGDADSDVYRLTLFLHHTLKSGVGIRAGVGFADASRARGHEFNGTSGAIFDLGSEFPFSQKLLRGFSPYFDVHAAFGEAKLSGLFFGVGTKI